MTERPRRLAAILASGSDAYNPDDLGIYGNEEKLIAAIARAATQIEDDEAAGQLWSPFVTLGAQWEQWVKHFLDDWLSGPTKPLDVDRYVRRWRSILARIREIHMYSEHDLYAHALGIDAIGPAYWDDCGPRIIEGVKDLLAEWAVKVHDVWNLRKLARYLRLPACAGIWEEGIVWVLSATKAASADWRSDVEVGDEVAALATNVWAGHKLTIRLRADLRSTFGQLVDVLASHHIAAAVQLQAAMRE
jgi:hypothetical protein